MILLQWVLARHFGPREEDLVPPPTARNVTGFYANFSAQKFPIALKGIAIPIASTFSRYRRVSRYTPPPSLGVIARLC